MLLGGQENSSRQAAEGIVALEHKLAEISTPDDQRRDDNDLYNPMTIDELNDLAPFVGVPSRCYHLGMNKAFGVSSIQK